LLVAFVALPISGCGRLLGRAFLPPGNALVVPAYRLPPNGWKPARLMAGSAKADITPSAGFPTGGHGPEGAMSRGYWTKLYARAFVFADAEGSVLVMVTCDLFAIPGGLSAEVSRRVGQRWSKDGVLIPPQAIVISATHTHQSPGNYMTAGVYNRFASKYPGFDKRLFDFLADRITTAINSAMIDARRDGIVTLSIHRGSVGPSVLLNRSPMTFLSNWNAGALMNAWNPPEISCKPDFERGEAREHGWDAAGCPRLRAIDRNVTILETRRDGKTTALQIFFAVHPTGLKPRAPFYSSDFVGLAMSALERELSQDSTRPVVAGFFNGAEGDIVPRRGRRDLLDVQRLADSLLVSLRKTLRSAGKALEGPVIRTSRAILKPGQRYAWATWGTAGLPEAPVLGSAGFGGPEDDRTVFYRLGWREGQRDIPTAAQGGKLGGLDSNILPIRLTRILAQPYVFPREIPVTYAELGELSFVAMPGEMSAAAGAMLRDSLKTSGRLEIVGLASEYTSYVATPDEYAVQDYMGASTIWGPNEMHTLGWAAGCLARINLIAASCRALPRNDPLASPRKQFLPGAAAGTINGERMQFGPAAVGAALNEVDDELDAVLLGRTGAPERNLPRFEWNEISNGDADDFSAASRRRVVVLVRKGSTWTTRESRREVTYAHLDGSFLVLMRHAPPRSGTERNTRRWAAIWLAPILEPGSFEEEYRFQVTLSRKDGSQEPTSSCPFRVNLAPARRAPTILSSSPSCER